MKKYEEADINVSCEYKRGVGGECYVEVIAKDKNDKIVLTDSFRTEVSLTSSHSIKRQIWSRVWYRLTKIMPDIVFSIQVNKAFHEPIIKVNPILPVRRVKPQPKLADRDNMEPEKQQLLELMAKIDSHVVYATARDFFRAYGKISSRDVIGCIQRGYTPDVATSRAIDFVTQLEQNPRMFSKRNTELVWDKRVKMISYELSLSEKYLADFLVPTPAAQIVTAARPAILSPKKLALFANFCDTLQNWEYNRKSYDIVNIQRAVSQMDAMIKMRDMAVQHSKNRWCTL